LAKEGLGTKNLPDAINWHFAGTWTHIFSDCSLWPKSEDLLRRAIAIPIYVKMDENQINKVIKIIREIPEKI